jgi:hypothetical protein
MEAHDLDAQAQFIAQVAREAVDEADAIARHPEIVDVLLELSQEPELLIEQFGDTGPDPASFVQALAEGLTPYRQAPLEEAPELITGLALVAEALQREVPQPFGY